MKDLQTTMLTYNTTQRATKIYQTVVDVFDWDRSSDCVTPFDLAFKQVEATQVTGTLCIPGAGIGTYVLAAMQRGLKPENIYAVELDAKYYELGSAMFERFGVNYVLADFLAWQPEMQFDVVIGNPPYQRPREVRNVGTPLWPEFIEKGMDLLKDGGVLDLLVPATWMNRKKRGAWKFIAPYDLTFVDPDIKHFFPDVGGNGGTFSRLKLEKRPYGGVTSVQGKFSINFHTKDIPENNRLFTEENLSFLSKNTEKVVNLDVKSGSIKPSINSDHWSPEKTERHIYETYYSGDSKRRSVWCDQPVGDHGKLKLVVAASGNIYNTFEITTKGVGRQASYVLGTQEELEKVRDMMLSAESKYLCELKTAGNFTDPLRYIVR